MSDFRELMFWPIAVMFLWAVVTTVLGFATWSKGGPTDVYLGLVFVVGLGFILLDGVVSDSTRVILTVPAYALLIVWRVQQQRGRWPPERKSESVR